VVTGRFVLVAGLVCSLAACDRGITLTTGKDEQSFLPYWQFEGRGINLRLVQRLPDQTRGLYQRLGFTEAQAEQAALGCAFQTVFRNTSQEAEPSPLRYDLREWKVMVDGKTHGLKVREDWEQDWAGQGVGEAARRNFEWGLVPTEMQYEPGDYNWGISFYRLGPGDTFDLEVIWHQYGKAYSYTIKGMQCAPDIHPDPEEFRRENEQ